ncbi:hypothetical protein ACMFWY_14070 [Roseiconus sp. JC912]
MESVPGELLGERAIADRHFGYLAIAVLHREQSTVWQITIDEGTV